MSEPAWRPAPVGSRREGGGRFDWSAYQRTAHPRMSPSKSGRQSRNLEPRDVDLRYLVQQQRRRDESPASIYEVNRQILQWRVCI